MWSDLFALTIEHSPAAVAVFDSEMRYLVASRRWAQDFGVEGETLVGRSHYDVFPDVPQHRRELHQRCLTGAVERGEEERFVHRDGRVDWMRWEVRPWHAASGDIGGIIIFAETITEHKRVRRDLQRSEERLRLAVTGANIGTWHWNPESVTGCELAATLQSAKPSLRTILCSGYSTANIAEETAAMQHCAFLQKPYRSEELLTLVQRLLHEP